MRAPLSTYRVQLTPSFGLREVAAECDYIRRLGADWLYLSPLLTAEQGSLHGYDVIDHSRVDPQRGGSEALEELARHAHELGLGILVDIVPNHMGIATPRSNAWWWDVLRGGEASPYAEAFDVDWDVAGGKVRVPIAEDASCPEACIDGDVVRVGDRTLPLAPGSASADDTIHDVLARQHYVLISPQRADTELNYRRFFAVQTLAGVRVEVPWVFEETHAEILRWVHAGIVDGLRIDHPDGLADPGGYLDALSVHGGDDLYLVVEKIITGEEQLPTSWPVAGTTGYDALAEIDRVLVDPAGRTRLEALDSDVTGADAPTCWHELVHTTKRAVADGMLRSEVERIERDVRRAHPEFDLDDADVSDAIAELLAGFPVYRSYLPLGVEHLERAANVARNRRPDLATAIDALLPVLRDPHEPAAVRFQQTSGMVMAKGVEDSAFYRYPRLSSLNEVGGDPSVFALDVDAFHLRQQVRQATLPSSLTTLTTHDTKRSEDVRARLHVLAEVPSEWRETYRRLDRAAPIADRPVAHVVWQAVIGSWPASRQRLVSFAIKAAREAATSTSWVAPNESFERTLRDAIGATADDDVVRSTIDGFVELVRGPGWINSLSAKLIQLTAPGVPDVYQGSELWEMSLVDPDNRRRVDFGVRRQLLDRIDAGWVPPVDDIGAAKLALTARALRLRREQPHHFTVYRPITSIGPAAAHVVAFDRGGALTVATRLPLGLQRAGGWRDTVIVTPSRPMVDVLTGRRFDGGALPLAHLLEQYPIALLSLEPRW